MKSRLTNKLKHPASLIAIFSRLGASLLFFVNPLVAWVLWLILDGTDHILWNHFARMTPAEYENVDKIIDMFIYIIMFISSLNQNMVTILILAMLLLFRLIGQIIFWNSKNERFLILFPNLFEVYWIWAILIPFTGTSPQFKWIASLSGLFLIFILKMVQELFIHYFEPHIVVPWFYTLEFFEKKADKLIHKK